MEIIGRLTKDAEVKTVKNNKTVVVFTLVVNDSYNPKGGERVEVPTFYNCSYWLSDKIAEHLTKGSIVQVNGRIGMNVYKNMNGDAQGSLTFHTNTIKIVHKYKPASEIPKQGAKPSKKEKEDDLPF